VNPLHQTEREVNVGGLTRLISWLTLLTMICAVVLSWLLVRPSGIDGVWILASWGLIVAAAVLALILWGSAGRVNNLALRVFAMLVIVLGTVTAFLSGDKFDTLRAVAVSIIMIVMSYRGRNRAAQV
jgi:intracellular septation protein A